MKILNFGSLNIDYVYKVPHFVRKGETLSSESLRQYPGGKGLNQSVALAKAGMQVWHAGIIGKEGGFLLEEMQKSGVGTEYVRMDDTIPTGHAIIQNDSQGDNCILQYGGTNQRITEAYVDEVLGHFSENDCILLQNEINLLSYIITGAKARGMKVILNPSPMDEGVLSLPLKLVDLFFVNEVEAKQLILSAAPGYEMSDYEALADRLKEMFPKTAIVLTLGEEGAMYLGAGERIRQAAYRVEVTDTTAAGDTFTGFFLAGMLQQKGAARAMEYAAKAAAITCSRPGASVSIPYAGEVARA